MTGGARAVPSRTRRELRQILDSLVRVGLAFDSPRIGHHGLRGTAAVAERQIEALEDRIGEQLTLHPDAEIFTSLPRSGSIRAAQLLAEIGDARG
jgi:hypothetical protein